MSVVILTATAAASAQPPTPPAGAGALSRARDAWTKKDFRSAERLFVKALDDGGLAPTDVVDTYVRIGVARAVLGQNNPALAAFREAALIDAKFVVPAEATSRASYLAEFARKEKSKFGSLALAAEVPSRVKPGAAFTVSATLDAAHLTLAASITITVKDSLSQKSFTQDEPPALAVTFEVPARVTLPGASLSVRVDALDAHANRLASFEKLVRVDALAALATGASMHGPRSLLEPTSDGSDGDAREGGGKTGKDKSSSGSSGGFWSSPWPYIIGGAALAAGGAAVFFTTRHTDDVIVAGAHVQTVP